MPAERAPLDLAQLFAVLDRHGVEYTIIGGVAVQVHGVGRTTLDLDLIPDPSPDNVRRLAAALRELDARPTDMPWAGPPTEEQLAATAIVPPLATAHGDLRVLNDVPGARTYERLRADALVLELDGISLAFASRDDLVAMKRATNRPQDRDDIAALTGEGPA